MAIQSGGMQVSTTWLDGLGNLTNILFKMTGDFAQAQIDLANLFAFYGAATDMVLVEYVFGEFFFEDTVVPPPVTVRRGDKASITVNLDAEGSKRANLQIAGPSINLFAAASGKGAKEVAYPGTANATANLLSIFATGTQLATISDGEAILPGIAGFDGGKRISARLPNG